MARRMGWSTFGFGPVKRHFSNSEVHVKGCDLLPEDQQVLDQEQLSIHWELEGYTCTENVQYIKMYIYTHVATFLFSMAALADCSDLTHSDRAS